jgi:hypothetical protein
MSPLRSISILVVCGKEHTRPTNSRDWPNDEGAKTLEAVKGAGAQHKRVLQIQRP